MNQLKRFLVAVFDGFKCGLLGVDGETLSYRAETPAHPVATCTSCDGWAVLDGFCPHCDDSPSFLNAANAETWIIALAEIEAGKA